MHPLSEELLLKNALPIRIVDRQTTSSRSRKGENTKNPPTVTMACVTRESFSRARSGQRDDILGEQRIWSRAKGPVLSGGVGPNSFTIPFNISNSPKACTRNDSTGPLVSNKYFS